MTKPPQKTTPRQRVDGIYQIIRERICLMHYMPGTLLREAVLAEEFGLSRTPIRQVIKKLEFEGLVVSQNGVGTLVTDIELEGLSDIYEMRLKAAELIGVMNPVRCGQKHLNQLIKLRRQTDELENIEELARINHELHNLITSLIGNQALRIVYDQYYFQTTRVWYRLIPDLWQQEVTALQTEIDELIVAARRNDVTAIGFVKRNFIARVLFLIQQNTQPQHI
ncbi:MAG: GntR family transcriptional regulator [Amphritea sp.]